MSNSLKYKNIMIGWRKYDMWYIDDIWYMMYRRYMIYYADDTWYTTYIWYMVYDVDDAR